MNELDQPAPDVAGRHAVPTVEYSSSDDPRCGRVHFLECAVLIAMALVALGLAWHYPSSHPATSWREKDWRFWYNAQQLYGRDPDELTESQFENVKKWCRCSRLVDQYHRDGLSGLTDEDCLLVVETLEELCPNLHKHAGLLPVYEACRRRLADAPSGTRREINTRDDQTR